MEAKTSKPLVPEVVSLGLKRLFHDHAHLNDFIMDKNGIDMKLSDLVNMAKTQRGVNDKPSVWLRSFCHAMRAELTELEESIAWKWWKPHVETDMENVRVEIIDLLHFLMSAAMAAGMSAEEFAEIYYRKRQLNIDRQVEGFVDGDNEKRGVGNL